MQSEYIKYYILSAILAIVLYVIVENKTKEAKLNRKINIFYGVIIALIIGLVPVIGYLGLRGFTLIIFICIQVLLLVLGILHNRLLIKYLPWFKSSPLAMQFLYSISMLCLGGALMLLLLDLSQLTAYPLIMLSGLIWFFVPLLFSQSWKAYISLPIKQFKSWRYPIDEPIDPPTDEEMNSLVVIAFEFLKTTNETERTVFRAKAPVFMSLGRLFYYFINDYNDRHPDTPIEYSINGTSACHWLFYVKPKWYQGKKYLDYESAIKDNGVKENSVIVCQRVNQS